MRILCDKVASVIVGSLKIGALFKYSDAVYMLTDMIDAEEDKLIAVNLQNGKVYKLNIETEVTPFVGTLQEDRRLWDSVGDDDINDWLDFMDLEEEKDGKED